MARLAYLQRSFAAGFLTLFFAAPGLYPADAKKGLAKVAILTFEDETGTKNFGYMPNSLTEAIDKSLQKRFEYVREEPAKSESDRRNIKSSGIFSAKEAAEYCRKNDVQILVFGKFAFDPKTKQIVVDTFISLGTEDKFRELKERRNPTDASIFSLADKVADDIVREMTGIAKEQLGSEKKTAELAKNEKLELKKSAPVVWSSRKWQVNLAVGSAIPTSDLQSAYSPSGALNLGANRLLWRGLYAGATAQFFKLNTKSGTGGSFSSSLLGIPVTANVGYSFFFWSDRWRFNAEFGVGYYFAKFEVKGASGSSESTIYTRNFSNPVSRAAVSLQWLLFQWMPLGLELYHLTLYDQGQTSGKLLGLVLSVGYAF
jgi:hypothetical protein